jgi:LacI family transcriptional regulator
VDICYNPGNRLRNRFPKANFSHYFSYIHFILEGNAVPRATIKDVAAQPGASKAAVSHVITETRFVGEDTRQKVLQAIDELQYQPNAAARSLTTKRTGTIGMLISDSSNPFFGEILLSVEEVLRPKDYALIICNTTETLDYEAHYLDLLLNQRVDGIIAAATSQPWIELSKAEVQHTPIVFVDRNFDNFDGFYVGVDNRVGAYK